MKKIRVFFWVAALALTTSCTDQEFSNVARKGDYLPTNQSDRYFLRESFAQPDLAERFQYDTIRVSFAGSAEINNIQYQKFDFYSMWDNGSAIVEVHDAYRYFRHEGSRYYQPALATGPNAEEHIFLDTEKPAGSSWQYLEGFENEWRTTYTIKAVNAKRTINEVEYTDVIEVETRTEAKSMGDEDYYLVTSQNRYYARGVGEVYSLFSSYTYTGALQISSLK